MIETSLTIGRMATGLNNQRLCLLGLFALAEERGAGVVLPEEIVDFEPRADGQRSPGTVPLWSVFDREAFLDAAENRVTFSGTAPATVTMHECFTAAGPARRDATPSNFAGRFLLGTIAAAEIRVAADDIVNFLARRDATPVQLRIERDWQRYLRDKKRNVSAELAAATDPAYIFGKIRNTPAFASTDALWACCDEDDLLLSKAEIKRVGTAHGFDVLFKSDLPGSITLPKETTKRAMLDFTICRDSPRYIGLSASSFSGMVFTMSRLRDRHDVVWFFDAPGKGLLGK